MQSAAGRRLDPLHGRRRYPGGLRRAARLADGYFPGTTDPETLTGLIRDLGEAVSQAGKPAGSVPVGAIFGPRMADPVAGTERLAAMGVSRAMAPAFLFAGSGGLDRLGEFGEKVVTPLKD